MRDRDSDRNMHSQRSDGVEPSSRLGVFGMSFFTDEGQLRDAFSRFGAIQDLFICKDKEVRFYIFEFEFIIQTGKSRGFGFITFGSEREARSAVEKMSDTDLDGRSIRVEFAIDKNREGGGRSRERLDKHLEDRRDRSSDRRSDRRDRSSDRRRDRSNDRYEDRRERSSRDSRNDRGSYLDRSNNNR